MTLVLVKHGCRVLLITIGKYGNTRRFEYSIYANKYMYANKCIHNIYYPVGGVDGDRLSVARRSGLHSPSRATAVAVCVPFERCCRGRYGPTLCEEQQDGNTQEDEKDVGRYG